MNCEKYAELMALVALGEASEMERDEVMRHVETCERCRSEYDELTGIAGALAADPTEELTEVEQLKLENRVLRRVRTRLRDGNQWQVVMRIAAAVILFGLGYATNLVIGHSAEGTQPLPMAVERALTREEMLRAVGPGVRFSAVGLRAITLGKQAWLNQEGLRVGE